MESFDQTDQEENIHYFQEIGSTMDEARKMARVGCPPFTAVVAERQTRGRGRLKRTWDSATGGLYFTLVLRPDLPPADTGRINFLASVILARVLREFYHIDAGVKWPNDILVNGKKIAGMLSEMETDGNTVQHVNIGIGLNVNNDPTPVEPNATSLKLLLGKEISRSRLLKRFLHALGRAIPGMTWPKILGAWRELTVTLGRQVTVTTTRETAEGTAVDVDDDGALVLRLADGTLKTIVYGDCFIK